jgi:hypothetical protein
VARQSARKGSSNMTVMDGTFELPSELVTQLAAQTCGDGSFVSQVRRPRHNRQALLRDNDLNLSPFCHACRHNQAVRWGGDKHGCKARNQSRHGTTVGGAQSGVKSLELLRLCAKYVPTSVPPTSKISYTMFTAG